VVFSLDFLAILVASFLVAGPMGINTPAQTSPPLSNLVREYEPVTMPEATAYVVYTTSTEVPHQVWYRVAGGDALFRQRLQVYQENAGPRPTNQLPPESQLLQTISTNTPTGWVRLPIEQGFSVITLMAIIAPFPIVTGKMEKALSSSAPATRTVTCFSWVLRIRLAWTILMT
jgi:hypothetical protein